VKPITTGIALMLIMASCTGTATPTAPDPADSVQLVRVLDGDSLVVDIDGAEIDVRLLGINTPERDECFDAEAKARTTELAANRVRLVGNDEDRFGRLLRYAYAADDTLINQQLVAEGLALALSTGHALRDEFKQAEAEAFRQRIGRWQPDACGPAVGDAVEISGLEYDAPGDDARNPNGEWVGISNTGSLPARLDGWSIQDESSSHRFGFPSGFSLAPGADVRVSSGCGQPSDGQLFWCDEDPVWTNSGDTAYLLDPAGNVVDRWAF
jgi:endonuclease YncB( thermonuclease family)